MSIEPGDIETARTKVTRNGQVTIPGVIRHTADIQIGDEVKWVLAEGKLRVVKPE